MGFSLDASPGPAIYRTAMRLRQEFGARLRPVDLTPEQFAVLACLWEDDGLPQRALAERLCKDKPNVTRILDRLQEKGLIERAPDPQDRRAYRVRLTAPGRAIQEPVVDIASALRRQAYRGLSPSEQARLVDLLQRVCGNLDNDD